MLSLLESLLSLGKVLHQFGAHYLRWQQLAETLAIGFFTDDGAVMGGHCRLRMQHLR